MAYRPMGRQGMGMQGGGQFPLQQQGMAQQAPMMQQQPNYGQNAMRLGQRMANSTDPAQQANIQQRLQYLNDQGRIGDNRMQSAMGQMPMQQPISAATGNSFDVGMTARGDPLNSSRYGTQGGPSDPNQTLTPGTGADGRPPLAWQQPMPAQGPRGLLGPPPNQGLNALRLGFQASQSQDPALQAQNMQRLGYLHDQGRIGDRRYARATGMMPQTFQRQS